MSEKYWVHIKKLDNTYGMVSTNHPTIMTSLYNFMTTYAFNYKFMPKYKAGLWDGKIHFMEKNGKFALGLVRHIYRFILQDGLEIIIDDEITFKNEITLEDLFEKSNEWLADGWIPKEHQYEGALKSLNYRNGIIEHATSSGKSLTIALICMYSLMTKMCKKILIIVPTVGLVEQMKNDFLEYGVPEEYIGKFYGLEKETEQPIIISTWQSMCKQTEIIEEFDAIIGDEAHTQKANVCRTVAERAVNAKIRIGCTGTMPEEKCNRWLVEGLFGPVLHQVTAKYLIDNDYASDIHIKIPFIEYPESIVKKLKGLEYDDEKKWLEGCDQRNEIIKKITQKHVVKDHNILILVDHIDHAKKIVEKIKQIESADLHVVTGEVNPEKREAIRNYTNNNKKVVLVATYGVFSTGISIKRLHSIIFASAGKSKIKTMQSVGRGMRMHHEKTHLILYDIGDALPFSEKHLKARIQMYDKAEFKVDMIGIPLV
jgi:superfamily II DNA or RNA helicase